MKKLLLLICLTATNLFAGERETLMYDMPVAKWIWDVVEWKEIRNENDPDGLTAFLAHHDIITLKAGTVVFTDKNDLFDYIKIRPIGTDTYYYIPVF